MLLYIMQLPMTPVFIVLIVFSFIAFIVKMGLDHEREGRMLKSSRGQNSLSTSELRSLIRDAVEDSNVELKRRLDTIERRLERSAENRQLSESTDADEQHRRIEGLQGDNTNY